jgi:hypothetical protein
MIISRRHGFVFIHVPKTGGTSVEVALADHLAWDDLILGSTPLGFAMNTAYQARHGLFDHGTLADVAAVCGPEFANSSFVFATVRHPLDRLVSLYNFLHTLVESHCRHVRIAPEIFRRRIMSREVPDDPDFCAWSVTKLYAREPDFSAFLKGVDPTSHVTLRPQISFLTPPPGVKPLDRIIKLEELDETFPQLAGQLGLSAKLGRLNRSTLIRLSPRDVTPVDRRRIEELYYEDMIAFDYTLR